ncbi:MAG: hypothetical protein LBH17_04455 [Oscillospiraceae bacterium]|jgi:hypothetical protein|nr:hypothetical protein [Oscillospiraceae bacterium]
MEAHSGKLNLDKLETHFTEFVESTGGEVVSVTRTSHPPSFTIVMQSWTFGATGDEYKQLVNALDECSGIDVVTTTDSKYVLVKLAVGEQLNPISPEDVRNSQKHKRISNLDESLENDEYGDSVEQIMLETIRAELDSLSNVALTNPINKDKFDRIAAYLIRLAEANQGREIKDILDGESDDFWFMPSIAVCVPRLTLTGEAYSEFLKYLRLGDSLGFDPRLSGVGVSMCVNDVHYPIPKDRL